MLRSQSVIKRFELVLEIRTFLFQPRLLPPQLLPYAQGHPGQVLSLSTEISRCRNPQKSESLWAGLPLGNHLQQGRRNLAERSLLRQQRP